MDVDTLDSDLNQTESVYVYPPYLCWEIAFLTVDILLNSNLYLANIKHGFDTAMRI